MEQVAPELFIIDLLDGGIERSYRRKAQLKATRLRLELVSRVSLQGVHHAGEYDLRLI